MRRNRFYYPGALSIGDVITLDEAASHHLARVLRAAVDDELILFTDPVFEDGAIVATHTPGECLARICDITKRSVTVKIISFTAIENESPLKMHLAQAITRGEKMDLILQKAVELGVNAITPIITSRCGVKLRDDKIVSRQVHWRAVMQSAAEQSGRVSLPVLHPVIAFDEFIAQTDREVCVVCDPHANARMVDVKDAMNARSTKCITVCIGPEGGFDEAEILAAKNANAFVMALGPRILRTETAGLAMLSVLQYALGDFQ